MRVSTVLRVLLFIRLTQSFERIGDPNLPVIYGQCFKNGTHVNSRATTPHSGFDEITRNIVLDYVDDARAKILQSLQANHCIRARWPVGTDQPFFRARLYDFAYREVSFSKESVQRQYHSSLPVQVTVGKRCVIDEVDSVIISQHLLKKVKVYVCLHGQIVFSNSSTRATWFS